jgi:hypothetical protein
MKESLIPLLIVVFASCQDDAVPSSEADQFVPDMAGDRVDEGDLLGDLSEDIPQSCGTALPTVPEGLIEMAYDDGVPFFTVEDYRDDTNWVVEGDPVGQVPLYQAVRFELDRPAKVWGFSVNWGYLPSWEDEEEVSVGIYPDFGYNGFDFWQYESIWEGSRCMGDLVEDEWVYYGLETPLEVDHPELLYVAHRREGSFEPSLNIDGTIDVSNDCGGFDDCHSAFNMPETAADTYYNGASFPFANDIMIRLYVEYTEETPLETVFSLHNEEIAGSRVSWGDYDGDGWIDLFAAGRLWGNQGGGEFEDVTAVSGIEAMALSSSGGVWGDFNNDGCLDLFVFAESTSIENSILQNRCDGTFVDVTEETGVTDYQEYNDCGGLTENVYAPATAAAWWDIDNDGFLDLYVSNMICWSNWEFYVDNIWHNEGDGTFSDWTGIRGFQEGAFSGRGANPVDYDRDGDVDLLVNNYTLHQNLFYINDGDGTVVEKGWDNGLAGEDVVWGSYRYYGHTIGAAWGDLDNDGDFDAILANLAHPRFYNFSDKTQVMINDGTGYFEDIQGDWSYPAGAAGLRYSETHSVPVVGDFDNDGIHDLVISATYDGRPTDFYWGQGDGTFQLDSYHSGLTFEGGWGMAAADMDHDGDLDLVTSAGLYENRLTGEERGHWLQVTVVGDGDSNLAGLSATVEVNAGDASWLRHVNGGSGQGCQDAPVIHVGTGDTDIIDTIMVNFPGGDEVTFTGPFDVDQHLWLFESGEVHYGFDPPE